MESDTNRTSANHGEPQERGAKLRDHPFEINGLATPLADHPRPCLHSTPLSALRAGLSKKEVAAGFGLGLRQVYRIAKQNFVRPWQPVRRWTPEQMARLRDLIAATPAMSASQIGAALGVSRNAVIGICHRRGLRLPRPSADKGYIGGHLERINSARRVAKAEHRERVRVLVEQHITPLEISRLLGVSRDRVYNAMRKLQIKPSFKWHPDFKRPREERTYGRRGPSLHRDLPVEHTATEAKLWELTPCQCRWPTRGSGLNQFFCGARLPMDLGCLNQPYCLKHQRR